jgi:adenine deaminase
VIAAGRIVAEDGRVSNAVDQSFGASAGLRSRVVLQHTPEPSDFELHTDLGGAQARVRVIGMVDDSLVSEAREHVCQVRSGVVLPDPANDVLRITVLERHEGSGRIGHGFISGLGLRDGAIAMTYCHVHQNLLVIGTSDEQMAAAAAEVERLGGGMAVVEGSGLGASVALPVGGVLTESGFAETAESMAEIEAAARVLGCGFGSPILAIAFSALPTIPAYGLTDLGLYDVSERRFVDVVLELSP